MFGIPIGIASTGMGLEICAIVAGIKKYNSIIKKKKKKHDEIVLLANSLLNSLEVIISKALIKSVISHDQFVLINNVQEEYDKMKQEIKKKDLNSSLKTLISLIFYLFNTMF